MDYETPLYTYYNVLANVIVKTNTIIVGDTFRICSASSASPLPLEKFRRTRSRSPVEDKRMLEAKLLLQSEPVTDYNICTLFLMQIHFPQHLLSTTARKTISVRNPISHRAIRLDWQPTFELSLTLQGGPSGGNRPPAFPRGRCEKRLVRTCFG